MPSKASVHALHLPHQHHQLTFLQRRLRRPALTSFPPPKKNVNMSIIFGGGVGEKQLLCAIRPIRPPNTRNPTGALETLPEQRPSAVPGIGPSVSQLHQRLQALLLKDRLRLLEKSAETPMQALIGLEPVVWLSLGDPYHDSQGDGCEEQRPPAIGPFLT